MRLQIALLERKKDNIKELHGTDYLEGLGFSNIGDGFYFPQLTLV
jgi:hypothetical protein